MTSFGHYDLSIATQTLPNRQVTAYLPEYEIKCIQIQEDPECDTILPEYEIKCIQIQEDPECDTMFVEFRLQEEFVERGEKFDWFLFIEDDIFLYDAFVIEKLEKFKL